MTIVPAGVPAPAPDGRRRAAAVVALASLALALLVLATGAFERWEALVAALLTTALGIVSGWYALTRRGTTRVVALGLGAGALLLVVAIMVTSRSIGVLLAAGVLGAVSVVAAEVALGHGRPARSVRAAPAARRPVLIMNLRSGGGKADSFDLPGQCRARGIEPLVLEPGTDLTALAEQAVADGADLLGMAGGDGSQALVAAVAARHGIPFVVVPAGTRNHFALDLGLDRSDVVAALDAYTDGVDVRVDLGEVNGRPFVNNASMGVYAEIVQSEQYRDAKVATAASILPDLLGPDARPLPLRLSTPEGDEVTGAQLLLVSNNPYLLRTLRGAGTRPRLDSGLLGVLVVSVRGRADAENLAALDRAGHVERFTGWREWTTPRLVVRCEVPVPIGLDGEASILPAPLEFVVRPGALTVRVPRPVAERPRSQAVRITAPSTLIQLWDVACGRPPVPAG
jgi:diacylglycerol kinase family enzyme